MIDAIPIIMTQNISSLYLLHEFIFVRSMFTQKCVKLFINGELIKEFGVILFLQSIFLFLCSIILLGFKSMSSNWYSDSSEWFSCSTSSYNSFWTVWMLTGITWQLMNGSIITYTLSVTRASPTLIIVHICQAKR